MQFGRFLNSLLTGNFGLYFWLISDYTSEKRGSSLIENHQEMAQRASHWQLHQMRDYFVYQLEDTERQIVALGGITRFQHLKQTGGQLATFQRLFDKKEYLLDQIRMIEPQIGLNVYTKKQED